MMLAAQPNAVQFGPFEDDTPDIQSIAVCNMVPIPPAYVHLVLDRALNPRALWEQVGGGGGGHHQQRKRNRVGGLLNWLRYALTLRKDTSGTPTALPPGFSLGAIGVALPTICIDALLQNHRWSILRQDLPALDPSRLAPANQV